LDTHKSNSKDLDLTYKKPQMKLTEELAEGNFFFLTFKNK